MYDVKSCTVFTGASWQRLCASAPKCACVHVQERARAMAGMWTTRSHDTLEEVGGDVDT